VRGWWLTPLPALLASVTACAPIVPLGSALPPDAPVRAELVDTPFFPQEAHQCGPAALAMVITASGMPVSPDQLVSDVYLPGRRGSLQAELLGAARRRGRLPYRLPGEAAPLFAEIHAGRPVLLLLNLGVDAWPVWHYAVLVGYDAGRGQVQLRSGRERRKVMSWRRFAGAWQRAGNWAVTLLEPGVLPARPDPMAYLEACAGLEAAGMLDAAARAYAAAAARWPENPLVHLGLGNVAYARGAFAAAAAAYRQGLRLAPDDAALRNNLAQALLDAGCRGEALAEARRAVELARGSALEPAARATLDAASRDGSTDTCADAAVGAEPGRPLSSPHEPR
jgi:hypothetical protein